MRYCVDEKSGSARKDGSVSFFTPLPFRALAKIVNCLCPDGKRRTVNITGDAKIHPVSKSSSRLARKETREPDTFFSVPATVKVKGKNVSGFVTYDSGIEGITPVFRAYQYGKNFGVFN